MAATSATQKTDRDSDAYAREIGAELAELRADIAALTKSVSNLGKTRFSEFTDKAAHASEDFLGSSKDGMKALRKELADLESQVESHVRAHPWMVVMTLMGLGFVVALLARR